MAEDDPYADKRRRLLDEIEQDARDTAFWTGRKAFSGRTMAAHWAIRSPTSPAGTSSAAMTRAARQFPCNA